jgi:hypothetical protein
MGKNVANRSSGVGDDRQAPPERKSGRTVFDESGHGVWEWQTATGVFQKDVTDQQLQRLEAPNLALVEQVPSEEHVWAERTGGYGRTSNRTPVHTSKRPGTKPSPLKALLKRLVGTG